MRIHYYPDTDSIVIHMKDGAEGAMGEDLNENVVLHRDDAGTLYEIEVVGSASKVLDLERFEVEGCRSACLPASTRKPAEPEF